MRVCQQAARRAASAVAGDIAGPCVGRWQCAADGWARAPPLRRQEGGDGRRLPARAAILDPAGSEPTAANRRRAARSRGGGGGQGNILMSIAIL